MLRLFLSSFAVAMAGTGFAFCSQLILAKWLGAEEYGIYSFIFSLSLVLGVIALSGFQNSVIRLIPSLAHEPRTKNHIPALIKFSSIYTLIFACLLGSIVYLFLYLTGLSEKYPWQTLLIGAVMVPFMVMLRLNSSFLRGFKKSTLSVFYETTIREIILCCILITALIIGLKPQTGLDGLVIFLLSLIIASLLSFIHKHLIVHDHAFPSTPTGLIKSSYREWITISLPMMMVIFVQRLLRRSDIIILGLMMPTQFVGVFAVAAQFSEAAAMGEKGVQSVFSPRAAEQFKAGELTELKALYKKMTLYGMASTGCFSLLIALLSPFILPYFGETYVTGYTALLFLLAGQFGNIYFGPVSTLMIMTQYERKAMTQTTIAMIGNIICNPVAIYFFGIEGAAATTAFFYILRAAMGYRFLKKQGIL